MSYKYAIYGDTVERSAGNYERDARPLLKKLHAYCVTDLPKIAPGLPR